jgi:hypothetical protein
VAVLLIAKFTGDLGRLVPAYDRAHEMIMAAGGAERFGELRHHCALGPDALYIVGVWRSADDVRARWESQEFEDRLQAVGMPSPQDGTAHDPRPSYDRTTTIVTSRLGRLGPHGEVVEFSFKNNIRRQGRALIELLE